MAESLCSHFTTSDVMNAVEIIQSSNLSVPVNDTMRCMHVRLFRISIQRNIASNPRENDCPNIIFHSRISYHRLQCHITGTHDDKTFTEHFIDQKHFLCLRVREPFELYCWGCGDFQYSNVFDNSLGKKRKFATSVDPKIVSKLPENVSSNTSLSL